MRLRTMCSTKIFCSAYICVIGVSSFIKPLPNFTTLFGALNGTTQRIVHSPHGIGTISLDVYEYKYHFYFICSTILHMTCVILSLFHVLVNEPNPLQTPPILHLPHSRPQRNTRHPPLHPQQTRVPTSIHNRIE